MNTCAICGKRDANKTNSHIIPSFLTSMVGSVNEKYRRGKEILYTVGEHITTAHIGQEVLPEELAECFDEITDERLEDLSKTDVAKDFIFCEHCEKKLGEYLESKYSNYLFHGGKISGDEAIMFWISVIWRMSKFDVLSFKLPTHIEASFVNRINNYIEAKDAHIDVARCLYKMPFNYRIVYCKNYSQHGAGFIYGVYDAKYKIASFVFGDVALCLDFKKKGLPKGYSFFGLEHYFAEATTCDGLHPENVLEIKKDDYKSIIDNVVDMMQDKRLKADREMVLDFWSLFRQKHAPLLPAKPNEAFIQTAIRAIYETDAKTGEKITHVHYAHAMGAAFTKVYGIKIKK